MAYQGSHLRDLARSCQFNLRTVKVMGSPAIHGHFRVALEMIQDPPEPTQNPLDSRFDQPVHVCVRPQNLRTGCGGKAPKKRLTPLIFTRLDINMEPRSIRPFFKPGDSNSGLKLSIHMVYQGFNLRDLARSCQFNLRTVKVMGSPSEPGRAEAPCNWSETSLIIIINQPTPPLALPWSIW